MRTSKFNIALLVVLLVSAGYAQTITKAGTTAGQFFKIGMSAQGTGMGDAVTAIVSDGSAIFWNPAGLAYVTTGELSASYMEWIAGIKTSNLTFSYPIPNMGTIGLYSTSLTIPQDEVTTVSQPEGTGEFFDGGDFSVGIGFAKKVTDRFSFGVTAKYLQERIWTMSASSFAVDVGSIYHSNWKNFRIGFVLRNYGTSMRFSGRANLITTDPDPVIEGNNEFIRAELELEDWDIPMHLTTSFAIDLISSDLFKSVLAVDMVHPNDNVEFFNVGLECVVMDMISLRAGSRHLGQENPVGTTAFGGGINIPFGRSKMSLDYSLTDFGPFKNVNQISLRYGF